jgi:trigger factor
MNVGESRKVTDKFPDEDEDRGLAGKEAIFDVRLIELKKKILPEADDTLAAQIKPESTLEGLKQEIRENLLSAKREEESRERRQEVIDYLIQKHQFEVPSSMVEHQSYNLLKSLERDFKNKGFSASQLKPEDVESIKKRAEHMVRSSLLLKEIAIKEKIIVDEGKVNTRIDAIAEQLNRTAEDTQKFLSGKGMMDRLRDDVLTDQVFEFLIQNAQVEKAADPA